MCIPVADLNFVIVVTSECNIHTYKYELLLKLNYIIIKSLPPCNTFLPIFIILSCGYLNDLCKHIFICGSFQILCLSIYIRKRSATGGGPPPKPPRYSPLAVLLLFEWRMNLCTLSSMTAVNQPDILILQEKDTGKICHIFFMSSAYHKKMLPMCNTKSNENTSAIRLL